MDLIKDTLIHPYGAVVLAKDKSHGQKGVVYACIERQAAMSMLTRRVAKGLSLTPQAEVNGAACMQAIWQQTTAKLVQQPAAKAMVRSAAAARACCIYIRLQELKLTQQLKGASASTEAPVC